MLDASEEYERKMYVEAAWRMSRDRIAEIIGRFHRTSWEYWPGTMVIANAIMDELEKTNAHPKS